MQRCYCYVDALAKHLSPLPTIVHLVLSKTIRRVRMNVQHRLNIAQWEPHLAGRSRRGLYNLEMN